MQAHATTGNSRVAAAPTRIDRVFEERARYIGGMKTSSLPAVPVEPALRAELEAALEEGESMDEFIEEAVRERVRLRREAQAAFIARGRASLEEARRTGVYHKAEDVLNELKDMLEDARRRKAAAARR
jgi:hypothetical protein